MDAVSLLDWLRSSAPPLYFNYTVPRNSPVSLSQSAENIAKVMYNYAEVSYGSTVWPFIFVLRGTIAGPPPPFLQCPACSFSSQGFCLEPHAADVPWMRWMSYWNKMRDPQPIDFLFKSLDSSSLKCMPLIAKFNHQHFFRRKPKFIQRNSYDRGIFCAFYAYTWDSTLLNINCCV